MKWFSDVNYFSFSPEGDIRKSEFFCEGIVFPCVGIFSYPEEVIKGNDAQVCNCFCLLVLNFVALLII